MNYEDRTLEDLKKEADELGIKHNNNIGKNKLIEKIEAYYKAKETSVVSPNSVSSDTRIESGWTPQKKRQLALEREKRAKTTQIVEIIDNDQRVNNQTTSVTVNCTNDYFDLGTVLLPLNTPVEVMQGHIDVLKSIKIPQHVRGNDGLSIVQTRNRYSIGVADVNKVKD